MKKYMIRCDLEGVTGVVSYTQTKPGGAEFEFGRRMFMGDLLAMVNGLLDAGADQVHIYDVHFAGRNIDVGQLPEGVFAYCGKQPYRPDWAGGLDASFSGLLLLGFHSMAGTGELLNHTYEPDIVRMDIDGLVVGEIGLEAAIAGCYGVPLLMVTADSAGVAEAEQLVPGVRGVTVKQSLGGMAGICYPAAATAAWIHAAAREVASAPQTVKPLVTGQEVTLRVKLVSGPFAERVAAIYPDFGSGREVVLRGGNVLEAYAAYWQMKLRCLA